MTLDDRTASEGTPLPLLYNGLVETAARVHAVLDAFFPTPLSFEELRLLDFFAVFAGDLGAPVSLHPPLQGRAGAFAVRAPAVKAALGLLEALRFVPEGAAAGGTCVLDSEGTSVEGYLRSPYMKALAASCEWLSETMQETGREAFFARLSGRLAELSGETLGMPPAQADRFSGLAQCYRSDLERTLAIEEAAWMYGLFLRQSGTREGRSAPGGEWFEAVQGAATAEHSKIRSLAAGLEQVMA